MSLAIDRTAPIKILIIRLSSLGDVVHAMPVVADIKRAFPNAQIDWVVESSFAPILKHCEGLHRIIECSIRKWRRHLFNKATWQEWSTFRKALKQEPYDAILDIHGLTKSAIVSKMARLSATGKRYAMGNKTKFSGFEPPTAWIADEVVKLPWRIHVVDKARFLCASFLGYELPSPLFWGLKANENSPSNVCVPRPCVFFAHGSSKKAKTWSQKNWVELGLRLQSQGIHVAMTYGNDEEQQEANSIARQIGDSAIVWPKMTVADVLNCIALCDGVIGVDSGFSHIAVALDLPHVQIYNIPNDWRSGPLKAGPNYQQAIYGGPSPEIDAVWDLWQCVIKNYKERGSYV